MTTRETTRRIILGGALMFIMVAAWASTGPGGDD